MKKIAPPYNKMFILSILLICFSTYSYAASLDTNSPWHTPDQLVTPSGYSIDQDNDGIIDKADSLSEPENTYDVVLSEPWHILQQIANNSFDKGSIDYDNNGWPDVCESLSEPVLSVVTQNKHQTSQVARNLSNMQSIDSDKNGWPDKCDCVLSELDNDENNCGKCGNVCDEGTECKEGHCCHKDLGDSCGSCGGVVLCDGSCSISTPSNYNQYCGATSCINAGTIDCNGNCAGASYKTDGTSCGTNVICYQGSCVSEFPSSSSKSTSMNDGYTGIFSGHMGYNIIGDRYVRAFFDCFPYWDGYYSYYGMSCDIDTGWVKGDRAIKLGDRGVSVVAEYGQSTLNPALGDKLRIGYVSGIYSYPCTKTYYGSVCISEGFPNYFFGCPSCMRTGFEPQKDTCFSSGTRIIMSDGSEKNIENIEVGEFVLSYNERTRENTISRVGKVFHHKDLGNEDYYLNINNILNATPNHPFFVNGLWKEARDIKLGDVLKDNYWNDVLVKSVDKIYENTETYNLEVEKTHTYYAEGILVHNKCFPEGTMISMADGTKKPIEKISSGDEVFSYDTGSGKKVVSSVGYLQIVDDELFILNNGLITVSNQHPFYTKKKSGEIVWAVLNKSYTIEKLPSLSFVEQLELEDYLMDENGNWIKLYSINKKPGIYRAYNLIEVGDYMNYYADGFLVHNE